MARSRVLVVEDETIVAMDLKRALEGFGYTVPGIAISGSEALEMATNTRPDIVLMDIQLDGQMDGIDVANRLNDLLDVPIVFLTAFSNETTLQRAKTVHPFGFLLKPYQERELRGAVEVALYTHGMEKKLRRRESWLDAILRGMADGVVATDAAGFVVFMNPPAVALTGRTADQARGLTLAKVLRLIDDDQRLIQLDATSVDGGVRGPVSASLVGSDGNETPVEFTLTRMQDENRRPEGTVVVFRDLSLRLEVEQAEAVRRSEERLRALIEGGSDVIIVFDADLKIRFASPSIEQLTGYSAAESIGTGMLDYIFPEDHSIVMDAMKGTQQGSPARAVREYRARHRDGSIVIVETVSTDLLDHPLVQGIVVNARDVTDRKRIEAALGQSERDYRGLFENASDCIVIFEPEDERVLEANNRACEVYGFNRSELLGKSLKSLSENVERGRRQVDLTLSTDSVHQFETVHYRRDGSPLNLEITASVVDYKGTRAIYSIGRDVTERKHAEQALLRANRRLEILNTVWREIAAVRSPTQVVEAALAQLIELLPCEFASVALADPVSGESIVFVAVGDQQLGPSTGASFPLDGIKKCPLAIDKGVSYCPDLGAEGRACPLKGSWFGDAARACVCTEVRAGGVWKGDLHLVSSGTESFSNEDLEVAGEVAGVIGVALHQAHLRTELADREQRLEALVENLPEGVVCLDQELRVTLVNPPGRELLRVIAGVGVNDVVEHVGDQPVSEILGTPTEDLPPSVIVKSPDQRTFDLGIVGLKEDQPGAGGYIIVIRELTRELETRKHLEQQARLASVGQLAAGIAHDFNNMLQAISGFAQLIQTSNDVPAAVIEKAQGISQQGKRGAGLIRQILDFSRTSVSERRPLRLELIIKETVRMLERIISEQVHIHTKIDIGEHVVVADPTQIQQVVMNLAINARDAMASGGEITIGLDRVLFADEDPRPFPQMAPREWLRLTVHDDGAGMSPDVAARVFEPFFTTRAPGEGTGLGLAQVYGIVKQHDGFIDLETEVDVGTTFVVYLPIAKGEPREEDFIDGVAEKAGEGELVLLVEDEAPVRNVIHQMLETLGFEVVTADSGAEALQVFERFQSEIELVVSDVVLPGTSGMELTKDVQEMSPDLPIILMSGYPLRDEDRFEITAGRAGWINKPFSSEQLTRAITRVMASTGPN